MTTLGRSVDGVWMKEQSRTMDEFVTCWLNRVNPGDQITVLPKGGVISKKGEFKNISNKFVHAVEFLQRLSGNDPKLEISYANPAEWTQRIYEELWLPPFSEAQLAGKRLPKYEFARGADVPPGGIRTENGYWYLTEVSFWDYVAKRAEDETSPNHVLSVPNTIVAVVATLIDTAHTNWPLKCLATYIDSLGGVEPFLPGRDKNKISSIRVDCVAAIRITMLLQAALYWEQYDSETERNAMVAYIQFVFKDPNYNNAAFRKNTGIHRQSLGAGCRSGKYPLYNGATLDISSKYEGYMVADVKDAGHELEYLARMKEPLDNERKWVAENVPMMQSLLHDVIYGDIDSCIRSQMFLSVLGGLPGITQGNSVVAHHKNINIDLEQLKKDGYDPDAVYPATTYLYGEALNYSSRGTAIGDQRPGAQGSWLTWNQFQTALLRGLTTNSAGTESYQIDIEYEDNGRFVTKTINLNDKISVFFIVGAALFGEEAIKATYTRDHPGTIGRRRVAGGKADRAIYVVRITDALLQRMFFTLFNGQMERDQEFTLGNQTGTHFVDQFPLLFATVKEHLMIWGLDFSGFDVHQDKKIADPIREGLADGAESLTGTWGPFNNLSEAIREMLGDGKVQNTVFKSGRGEFPIDFSVEDPDQVKFAAQYLGIYLQMVDILLSGRGDTLHRNNVTNRAVTNYMTDMLYAELPQIMKRVQILKREFQGDDSTQVWYVTKKFTADELDSIVDVQTRAAARNRQELNRTKSVARDEFFEFLKVSGFRGKPVPLQFIQPLAAEKVNNLEEPSKLVAGYRNKLSSLVSRGFDEEIAQRLLSYTWALRRSIKIFSHTGEGGFVFPPFATLWVPESNHGVGMLPWSLGFSNNTMALMAMMKDDPIAFDVLNRAAWVASVPDPEAKRNAAQQVIDGGQFNNGINYVKGLQPNGRLRAAYSARRRLMMDGIKVPTELDYSNQAESLAKISLESTSAMRAIDLDAKTKKAGAMQMRMVRASQSIPDQFNDFAWMRTVTFYPGNPVAPVLIEDGFPHSYLSPYHAYLLRVLDLVSANHLGGLRINRLTQILNSDPHFMGRVADEQLSKLLTNPKYIANPARMADFLTAIGAGSDTVRRMISEIYGAGASNAILHKDVIGLNASVTAMASYSRDTQKRTVSIPPLARTQHPSYDILLKDYTLTVAVSEYYRTGSFRYMTSRFDTANSYAAFNSFMLGKSYDPENIAEFELLYANYTQ
jgi:hypothetical protein